MSDEKSRLKVGRREFLGGVGVAGAAAAAALSPAAPATAQTAAPQAAQPVGKQPAGYTFLQPQEALFVEALVDHMVPKDELTPSGTDIGIATFIDRALGGSWGKGDRLYMQGPWKTGVPAQGYQLPLTPAQLYRAGIEACNAYCRKTYGGKTFEHLTEAQREEVLVGLNAGRINFEGSVPARAFWTMVYQTVMEGMFADPIHGGNRNKAGWKLIGFPGVIQVNRENVVKFKDKPFPHDPLSISDMS
jgi:gluconate 2-dehydrogenase gamma chain